MINAVNFISLNLKRSTLNDNGKKSNQFKQLPHDFQANSLDLVKNYNIPMITFKPEFELSDNMEELTPANINKILPLYKKYQEGVNQNVDETKLNNFLLESLKNNENFFIIKQNNEPSGFIHFSTSCSTIDMTHFTVLQSVFVLNEKREQGLAKKMINEAKRWTEFKNHKGIFVKTIKKNENAVNLYKNLDFKNESQKYEVFFWPNEKVLNYEQGYVNTKKK